MSLASQAGSSSSFGNLLFIPPLCLSSDFESELIATHLLLNLLLGDPECDLDRDLELWVQWHSTLSAASYWQGWGQTESLSWV